MIEKLLAGLGLAICVLLLMRLLVGERLRWRLDAAARRGALRARGWALSAYHWRRSRRAAARVADEAIRRARGEWDGNVYKPKSFKRPRKPH